MYAIVSAWTILLLLKFAGGRSEIWRALVSLISCMFKISQYCAPLQIQVHSFLCYCVSHYHSYILWHTQLSISCLCESHRHIHALCTCGTRDVSMCWALASSVMSHWHIHCVHVADHGCIFVLSRSCFWIPILGQLIHFKFSYPIFLR